MRETPVVATSLRVRASQHERAIEVGGFEPSVLLYAQRNGLGESIEAKAILGLADFLQQPAFQLFVLESINLALKHRFLYPLPHGFTALGYSTQAFAACWGLGAHVVTDDDQHV